MPLRPAPHVLARLRMVPPSVQESPLPEWCMGTESLEHRSKIGYKIVAPEYGDAVVPATSGAVNTLNRISQFHDIIRRNHRCRSFCPRRITHHPSPLTGTAAFEVLQVLHY